MKKLILSLLIANFFISCKPQKSVIIEKERIRVDTIRDYKVITKFNAVYDTLIIENPCDSTGILNTFYSKITVPQGKIIIRSYKGNIQATVNIDSIENVYKNMYVSSLKSDSSSTNKEKALAIRHAVGIERSLHMIAIFMA